MMTSDRQRPTPAEIATAIDGFCEALNIAWISGDLLSVHRNAAAISAILWSSGADPREAARGRIARLPPAVVELITEAVIGLEGDAADRLAKEKDSP